MKPFQVGVTPECWIILLHSKVNWETAELCRLVIAVLTPVLIITYVTKALPNEPAISFLDSRFGKRMRTEGPNMLPVTNQTVVSFSVFVLFCNTVS